MSVLTLETPTPIALELPSPPASTPLRFRLPGIGEIKPHNVSGIRDGLRDLSGHLRTGGRIGDLRAGKIDALLLTYAYTPAGPTVRNFALRPHFALLDGTRAVPRFDRANASAWLAGLGQWHTVRAAEPPTHRDPRWIIRLGPTVRGSALEPLVRAAFITHIGRPDITPGNKFPNTAGPDVQWREVAEYLYELVGELSGDR